VGPLRVAEKNGKSYTDEWGVVTRGGITGRVKAGGGQTKEQAHLKMRNIWERSTVGFKQKNQTTRAHTTFSGAYRRQMI